MSNASRALIDGSAYGSMVRFRALGSRDQPPDGVQAGGRRQIHHRHVQGHATPRGGEGVQPTVVDVQRRTPAVVQQITDDEGWTWWRLHGRRRHGDRPDRSASARHHDVQGEE
jgi:hypothetical protein